MPFTHPRLRACPALAAALAATSLLAACSEKSPSSSANGAASAPAALPAGFFLETPPSEPQKICTAKSTAQPGDQVVIRGRIGGGVHPFTDGRAVFTMVDEDLPACSDNPDDACSTPWDYCCEKPADILAHAATVQVVGPDGNPLRTGLKGAGTLQELSDVIVIGAVAMRDDSGAFVVNAEHAYVVRN